MWLLYAIGSAFFAGITSILAKCGIRKTDSTVATAVRTVVILFFSWAIVLIIGSETQLSGISPKTLLFLILSGAATGASWLCYFRALQLGKADQVVPVDKSSTVLTIVLALLFLHEGVSLPKAAATVVIAAGIFMMIERKDGKQTGSADGTVQRTGSSSGSDAAHWGWFPYACGSAVFASLTAILGKIGISGVESNLGTAIRTTVVLAMAWMMVFVTGRKEELKEISGNELFFICASGLATGASWLCYYHALQEGPASVVAPIDKLSVIVTVIFAYFVFGEKLNKKEGAGLLLLVAGTIVMALL